MNKALGQKVKGYVQYNERIILVRFQTKPKDTIVAQLYMPTSNSSEEELEEVCFHILLRQINRKCQRGGKSDSNG